jgi:subtilisin family serine protease
MTHRLRCAVWLLAVFIGCSTPVTVLAQTAPVAKKKVASQNDLPRFNYPVKGPASALLSVDDATFAPFLAQVRTNLNLVLTGYDIQDRATLRQLTGLELSIEGLVGDNQVALATLATLRNLEDKPDTKLTTGLGMEAILKARLQTGADSGPMFQQAALKIYRETVNALPWDVVQDIVKEQQSRLEINSADLITGAIKRNIDPISAQSGTLDQYSAAAVVNARQAIKSTLPLSAQFAATLKTYITAHNAVKPDIWASRDVTLSVDQKLTQVLIGIWDSGVDTSLYPNQLYTDPKPGVHSPHGLAFDLHGAPSTSDLEPISDEQRKNYQTYLSLFQGLDDLQNQIDSPDAAKVRALTANTPPDQIAETFKQLNLISNYMHGTHVAGIAVRGNPAARLVVARFNDNIPNLPFAPTPEWANTFAGDFEALGDYFRTHNVRVVNMSWGDTVAEFEECLAKTTSEKDPVARKKLAMQIYQNWRRGVETAIKRAPNTLFVAAAGNSDSNAGFDEDVPASLHLPNLLVVGAVNQAGDETSFTSYGDTVLVNANGYRVDSYVPGGTRLKESGTSMASPNVANLAGKLFALAPSLTPVQAISLIRQGADSSADGRRHLINPKATIALLPKQ